MIRHHRGSWCVAIVKTESSETENEINQIVWVQDGCSYLSVNHEKVVTSLHVKPCKVIILRYVAFTCTKECAGCVLEITSSCSWEIMWLHLNCPHGAVISGDHGLQAYRGKICIWNDTYTMLSGKPGAFSSYSTAYYNFTAKELSQSTPVNTYFCMPTVYCSHADIPSNTHYTSLIMLFHENRNKPFVGDDKGYFPLCLI